MRLSFLCNIVALALFPFQILAGSFNLEMDQDPVLLGWTIAQGDSLTGSRAISNGLLTITSPEFYELKAPDTLLGEMSNASGWTIDARFRIVSGGRTTSGLTIWMHDNTELNIVSVGTGRLGLYDIPNRFANYNVGQQFHTYRLQGIGRRTRLSVDGQLIFDIVRTEFTGGTRTIFFGDGEYPDHTVSQWDYFRISTTIPEPSTVAFLTLVLLILHSCRPLHARRC